MRYSKGAPYVQTLEQRGGAGEVVRGAMGHGRLTQPEDANSDFGDLPDVTALLDYFQGVVDHVRPLLTSDVPPTMIRADYNVLSNIQYARAGADAVGCLGFNDQTGFTLNASGTDATLLSLRTSTVGIASPNFLMGIQLEWSIPKQYAQAFEMRMRTTGFKNFSGAVVDRDVTVKLCDSEAENDIGGIIQLPFAYRIGTSDSVGYEYYGSGGMQVAVISPSYLPPIPNTSTSQLPYINKTLSNPDVLVNVPANVRDFISVTARPITAASPALAYFRRLLAQ